MNNETSYRCTILIPTYNRPGYLRRILSYYNECGKNCNIIVADSSYDEHKKRNENIISSHPSIDLLHIKNFPINIDAYSKIYYALNHINTKYCVICADDDFITPNGIKQSMEFLEENLDFAAAHGKYITFYLKLDRKGKKQFRYYPLYLHKSISYPDAESRLFFHLSNNQISPFYAVYRTDLLKFIYKEALEFSDNDHFRELLLSMLTLIYGKMECLDIFYAAREAIPRSAGTTYKDLKSLTNDYTYENKYAKFRMCLALNLIRMSQLNVEESEKVIDNAISIHMKKNYPISKNLIKNISEFLDYFKLPDWMHDKISISYRKYFINKEMQMEDFMSSMNCPSSKYYDDFDKIRHHVLNNSTK